MGEVHFGSAETTDGWRAPFPVLGVAAALADELENPAPVIDQLERNQSDLSPELTDGEMNLASAELMETTDLKVCPLVDSASDTAEDYLHQVTGNTSMQATGSVGAQACGNIPGQSTGSLEIQETGSPDIQTAEGSDVATITSLAKRASAHVMVYPNFGPVNSIIITGNNNRELSVMDSDVAEASGGLERGRYDATVTTGVAGTEQETRTAGHQYNQISSSRVEPEVSEFEETSQKWYSHLGQTHASHATARAHTCEGGGTPLEGWMATVHEAQHPGLRKEQSVAQTEFTKLKAEVEMESGNKLETDRRKKSEGVMPDSSSSQKNEVTGDEDDEINNDDECTAETLPGDEMKMAEFLPNVQSDQPTSILEIQGDAVVGHRYVDLNGNSKVSSFSDSTQEVPENVAELDSRTLWSSWLDLEEPTEFEGEEILYSDIDLAMSENENVSENELITGSESAPSKTLSYSPHSERQRLTRTTRRPTRFRDSNFETQFQPKERKRKCNRIKRKDQTGNNVDNVDTHTENPCFHLGRGVKQKNKQEEARVLTGNRMTSLDQDRNATEKSTSRDCPYEEEEPLKRKQKSRPRSGWPARYKTSFLQQPSRIENSFESPFEAHKYLVTCSPSNENQQAKSKLYPATPRPDSKFSHLNQSSKILGPKATTENGNKTAQRRYPTGSKNQKMATKNQHPPVDANNSRNERPTSLDPSQRERPEFRLNSGHHRFKSRPQQQVLSDTAPRGRVNKTIIIAVSGNDPPAARAIRYNQCRAGRASQADTPIIAQQAATTRNQHQATPLTVKVTTDVSGNKTDDTISVSAKEEIKTTEIDPTNEREKSLRNAVKSTEIDTRSDDCNGKLPIAHAKSYNGAFRQQANRQVNTASVKKCKTTVSVPKAEINKCSMPEAAETKIGQLLKITISAKNSEINARTHQTSEIRRKKQMRTAKEFRRKKQMRSAKQTAGRLKKTEVQAPDATIPTSTTSAIPEAAEDDIIVKTAQLSQHHNAATRRSDADIY